MNRSIASASADPDIHDRTEPFRASRVSVVKNPCMLYAILCTNHRLSTRCYLILLVPADATKVIFKVEQGLGTEYA